MQNNYFKNSPDLQLALENLGRIADRFTEHEEDALDVCADPEWEKGVRITLGQCRAARAALAANLNGISPTNDAFVAWFNAEKQRRDAIAMYAVAYREAVAASTWFKFKSVDVEKATAKTAELAEAAARQSFFESMEDAPPLLLQTPSESSVRASFEAWALQSGWRPNIVAERNGEGYAEPFLTDYWGCWKDCVAQLMGGGAESMPSDPQEGNAA